MKPSDAEIFKPNKTSAKLLIDCAKIRFFDNQQTENEKIRESNLQRFTLLYDLFIKARSYAILNKISFNLSILFGIMILLWPSISIISKDFGWDKEFLKSAVVQTTITGIAILAFAVYSHYKKRQVFTENLMRYALYSEDSLFQLKEKVIQEMTRIDTGFSFSQAVFKKTNFEEEEFRQKTIVN